MFFQQILSGLVLGSIYALVALGFVLIYKATEVVNFAQGEFLMFGAFVGYSLMVIWGLPIWLGLFLNLILMGFLGMLVERIFIRPLIGEPLFVIAIVTIGLSIVMRTIAGLIWSFDTLVPPKIFSDRTINLGDHVISLVNLYIILVSWGLMIVLYLFFRFTRMGISMRATAQNQFATFLMGINVKWVFTLTWGLSAVVATIAGTLVSPIVLISPGMSYLGLKAFPAAILGGFGSIPGAIVGGVIIGISETLAGANLPEGFKDIFAYCILIGVLMLRPEGIFGKFEKKKV